MESIKTLGASNHCKAERQVDDYYATDPMAMELILEEEFDLENVLEPCCGEGHLSKVMLEDGIQVTSSDLIDRGFGAVKSVYDYNSWDGDIITNPPYKEAQRIIEHCLNIIPNNKRVLMFLKLQFMESKQRKQLFLNSPLKTVYVSSSRIKCGINGDFGAIKSSAVAYAWYVWEKGYSGDPKIKWIN